LYNIAVFALTNIDIKPICTAVKIGKDIVAVYYSSHVTPLHSHDELQIVIDLKTGFLFGTVDSQWVKCRGVVIKDQITHQLDTMAVYTDAKFRIKKPRHYHGAIDFQREGVKA
jgi:hypothetical protein